MGKEHGQYAPDEEQSPRHLESLIEGIRSGGILMEWTRLPAKEQDETRLFVTQLAITLTSLLAEVPIETLRERLNDVPAAEHRARLFTESEQEEGGRQIPGEPAHAPHPRAIDDPSFMTQYQQTTERLCEIAERVHEGQPLTE